MFGLALAGCGPRTSSYLPLHDGAEWTYEVNGRLRNSVEELRVTGTTSVDGVPGFIASGAMGSSRLAWKGSKVVATELGGIAYTPAIVLADFAVKQSLPEWRGEVRAYGVTHKATLATTQSEETFTLSGRKYPAIGALHRLKFGNATMETKLLFVQGLGIVSLEEHRDGQFLGSIHYLAGP